MTQPDLQSALDGDLGDDVQFETMKYVIKLQVDKFFTSFKVVAGGNVHHRSTLYGPSLDYNERGNSNTRSPSSNR